MNKILLIVGVCLLIISSVHIIDIISTKSQIKITPLYISEEGSEYSDVYKVDCGSNYFYTSYPDRLNFKEVCGLDG
jgi:hypothetical protein